MKASWKERFGTPKAHAIYAGVVAVLLIFAADFGAFVGTRCIPWDFYDNNSEYLTALLSAQHSIFGAYNPYEFGGMFVTNIFAYFDPVFWWFPFLTRSYPDLYQHQLIHLAHFFIIPVSMFFLAYLYGIRGKGFYSVALLSLVATYLGPTFELVSQGGESETYIWGFALIAALEWYRITGKRAAMIAAALFVSWATISSNEDMSYWPLALLAYAIAFWPELRARRHFAIDLALGISIAVLLTVPYFLLEYGLFQYVIVTKQKIIVEAANAATSIAYFGYNNGISMLALPGALLVMLVGALRKEKVRARWVLAIVLVRCTYTR